MTASLRPLPAQPRLVLDTNVVMALWHFADPALGMLQDCITSGGAIVLTRPECLDELQRVLAYPQFGIAPATQADILTRYCALAACLPDPDAAQLVAHEALPRCRDKDDQKFVTLAWDGAADALVTRDKLLLTLNRRKQLSERFTILTPERLQTLLPARQTPP